MNGEEDVVALDGVSYLCGCAETGGRIADFGSLLGFGPRPHGGQHDNNDEEKEYDEEQDH